MKNIYSIDEDFTFLLLELEFDYRKVASIIPGIIFISLEQSRKGALYPSRGLFSFPKFPKIRVKLLTFFHNGKYILF